MTSFILPLNDMFKVNKNVWVKIIKSKMFYIESGPDSNFVINSVSNFDFSSSESENESECDFSSVFINLDHCIFFTLYSTLLNKLADDFFQLFSWQNL